MKIRSVRDNERLNMTQTTISVNRDTAMDRDRYSMTDEAPSAAVSGFAAVFARDESRDPPCGVSAEGDCIDMERCSVSEEKLVS
jgi:hypothetical protein